METLSGFQAIVKEVKNRTKKTVVVAAAEDHDVLIATVQAKQDGLANFLYVGAEDQIRQLAREYQLELAGTEIMNEPDVQASGKKAIELMKEGRGQVLMKGKISTGQILGMVLKDEDLKCKMVNPFLSHVAIFEWQNSLKIFSDAALNIAPDRDQKKRIALNALQVARNLGMDVPRMAFISAVEKVNPKMPSSVDAEQLAALDWEGGIAGGPLAFDGAMFAEAYAIKGVPSPVEGKADILIFPNIETGNVFYKTVTWMMKRDMAGIIVGAAVPFILTSRADSARVKFLSIATTLYLAH
ncbi:MAG: phosphate acyltransferase [Candidatus Vecturithrix sp.]|jgi:phosphate butyryltransferase|nr:phosphate acyltransferase [Candidatus Vecturithrix sp.]